MNVSPLPPAPDPLAPWVAVMIGLLVVLLVVAGLSTPAVPIPAV